MQTERVVIGREIEQRQVALNEATGEVLGSRPLTAEERQALLFPERSHSIEH